MSPLSQLEGHVSRSLSQASAWRVALSEAGIATSPEFEEWLRLDEANEQAWAQVEDSWDALAEHATSPELLAVRRDALARAHRRGSRRWASSRWIGIAASFLILIGVGLSLVVADGAQDATLAYATAAGERRVLTLDDGSKISLDASTEVRVAYSDGARRLELLSGQARFDVAPDVSRPFSVRAGDRIVVATGTAFNVDLFGSRVLVTLIEGSVVVLGEGQVARKLTGLARPSDGKVALSAGQQLTIAPRQAPEIQFVNVEAATSWETGQLVFEDAPLSEIAARVSRYARRPIRVDQKAASLRVSGVFEAGDVAGFVDTVSRYLQIEPVPQADGSILLRPSA